MKTIYVLWSYDGNEGEIRCIFWFIFRTRACRDERAMPALMYGGGARNRLHRNAPKVGIYTDVFIAVAEPWPVGGHQVLDGAWAAVTRDFGQISFSRAHMPQNTGDGGPRAIQNLMATNRPRFGDGDKHICVYADLRRISVEPIARTAAVHQRRRGFRQLYKQFFGHTTKIKGF